MFFLFFPSLCSPTHPKPSQLGWSWVIVKARSSDEALHHPPSPHLSERGVIWVIVLFCHCPNDGDTKRKPERTACPPLYITEFWINCQQCHQQKPVLTSRNAYRSTCIIDSDWKVKVFAPRAGNTDSGRTRNWQFHITFDPCIEFKHGYSVQYTVVLISDLFSVSQFSILFACEMLNSFLNLFSLRFYETINSINLIFNWTSGLLNYISYAHKIFKIMTA